MFGLNVSPRIGLCFQNSVSDKAMYSEILSVRVPCKLFRGKNCAHMHAKKGNYFFISFCHEPRFLSLLKILRHCGN